VTHITLVQPLAVYVARDRRRRLVFATKSDGNFSYPDIRIEGKSDVAD
jgi:hypothetical protein